MPSHYGKSKMKSKSKGLKGGQKRLPMALKKKIMNSSGNNSESSWTFFL